MPFFSIFTRKDFAYFFFLLLFISILVNWFFYSFYLSVFGIFCCFPFISYTKTKSTCIAHFSSNGWIGKRLKISKIFSSQKPIRKIELKIAKWNSFACETVKRAKYMKISIVETAQKRSRKPGITNLTLLNPNHSFYSNVQRTTEKSPKKSLVVQQKRNYFTPNVYIWTKYIPFWILKRMDCCVLNDELSG